MAAILLGASPVASGATVGFGSTNVLNRFLSRQVTLSLPAAPAYAADFSGCCIDPATDEILAVMRGSTSTDFAIQRYTPDGALVQFATLTGFTDIEAICSVDAASNRYAVVEEGLNHITLFTFTSNTTSIAKSAGRVLDMEMGNLMNAGIEGLTWDAGRQCFYAVKEWQPLAVLRVSESNGTVLTEPLFDAALITNVCTDLSDVHFDAVSDRLLILSDESLRVVECDLEGHVLGILPVALNQPEGVTLSTARTELHVIGEPNQHQRFAAHWQNIDEGGTATFSIHLSAPLPPDSTGAVQLVAVNAGVADLLFTPEDGIARFTTNTIATVALHIPSDDTFNAPRDFAVALTNPVAASLADDQTTLLRVAANGTFLWSIDTLPGVGRPFRVTLTAQDAAQRALTAYAGPAMLALTRPPPPSGTLLTNNLPLSLTINDTIRTGGLQFQPNGDLVVTHLRYAFGNVAALWSDSGETLAIQSGPGTDGNWREVALTNPVMLSAHQTYRVGAARIGSPNPRFFTVPLDFPAPFAHGSILTGCQSSAVGFPGVLSGTAFGVDLRYQLANGGASDVSPAQTTGFENGLWSGWLTITDAMDNAILEATATTGQTGSSTPFNVGVVPQVILELPPELDEGAGLLPDAGRVTIAFDPAATRTVHLFAANTNLLVLPDMVTVTGGTESATFDLVVPDDTDLAHQPPVFVYATAPGHAAGTNAVIITDDESRRGLILRVTNRQPATTRW